MLELDVRVSGLSVGFPLERGRILHGKGRISLKCRGLSGSVSRGCGLFWICFSLRSFICCVRFLWIYPLGGWSDWRVGMHMVGGSRRTLPRCTAISSTNVSLETGLSAPVILRPLRHYLIPANLCVTLPRKTRTRIHPHDNLTLGGNVAILGSPNAVSTSCHNRIYIVLIGLSSRPFRVRSKRHVTRVIITQCRRTA